jgi:NAD+ diphosphatase
VIDWRSGSDLDRVEELRIDPEWVLAAWADPDALLLRVGDASVDVGSDGGLLTRRAQAEFDPEVHYLLGRIEGRPWFATRVGAGEELTSLRTVMDGLPAAGLEAAFTAVGLATWHDVSRFCPRCGSGTRAVHGGQSRKCTACGLEVYPRTDPAVIVAIVDPGDRLLLGRQPTWAPGRYSVFAGFVEVGESLEQTVHREMAEEVGLALTGVTYLGSQPWPFPRSLMVGFLAHATSDEPVPAVGEIEVARWFTREQLVASMAAGDVILPPRTSIARRMIESWLDGSLIARP